MEISDIIRCKEVHEELDELAMRYFDNMHNYGETYHGWRWSHLPNTITILYGFWNYHDEWDQDEYHITFDELINFSKNGTEG